MDEHTEFAGQQGIEQVVLENPETHAAYMQTVQHTAYILGGLAGLGMGGVFLLTAFAPTLPDTVVLLGSGVTTACIGGLVGFLAGRAVGAQGGGQ